MQHVALDFGTTNSIIATWDGQASIRHLPAISTAQGLIPSLVYIHDGRNPHAVSIGQAVRDQGLDCERDNRLFRNFKRMIANATTPPSRNIDGVGWSDGEAGQIFLRHVMSQISLEATDQVVMTAPVSAFHHYLGWLQTAIQRDVQIVDESTAAALGYAVTESGALVLVVDFGGGTLDLSLVKLPDSKAQTGGMLGRLLHGGETHPHASVIAKAGRNLGGSDIDQWLLAALQQRFGIEQLGDDYTLLLTACEQAKIALSSVLQTELSHQGQTLSLSRDELHRILEDNGFFMALSRTIDKVLMAARQQGIFKEDIEAVLMVGGTSLMPCVQDTLHLSFAHVPIRAEKPFTAVAEGALRVAQGYGVQDYLSHGYGLRQWVDGAQQYDEIIPMGTAYPTTKPIEVYLEAAHAQQQELELVMGELSSDRVALVEVRMENGQAAFVASPHAGGATIEPLNDGQQATVTLAPAADPGLDRLKADFSIDALRQLHVTVTDLMTHQTLLTDHILTTVR